LDDQNKCASVRFILQLIDKLGVWFCDSLPFLQKVTNSIRARNQ